MFYVYFHYRKTDKKLFYIGKGKGKRAWRTNNRNKYWRNTVLKYGYDVVIFQNNLTEVQALEIEILLISTFGIDNLVNMTNGGEGMSGYIPDQIARENMRKAQLGRKHSEEVKKKIALTHIGMKYKETTKKKLSEHAKCRKFTIQTKKNYH